MPTKKTSKSTTSKKTTEQTQAERKRKQPKYSSFKLSKKIPHPKGPIVNSLVLLKKSFKLIKANIRPLLGIVFVYAVLNFALVRGFASPLNINELKDTLKETFGSTPDTLTMIGTTFSALLGSSNSDASETSALYQNILFLLTSLAIIWVFRQSAAGNKPKIKEAFYNAYYPLVQFLLVVMVMVVQLVPAYIGVFIYGIVNNGDLAVSGLEQGIWLLFLAATITLSLYMLCSSLFALYIVTLPNMQPMQALRSARQLVFSRRLSVFRKLLILPVIALIILILIVVPAIYFIPAVAPWLYFVLTLASIIYLHAFLFTLYRELL